MADVIDVINPATEEILGQVPRGTAADAHAAVAAAKAAFPAWSRTPATVRAGLLHEAANKIQAHTDELTHLLTVEEGKPWVENEEEIFWVHDTFHYYAELGRHERGRFLPPGDPDQIN